MNTIPLYSLIPLLSPLEGLLASTNVENMNYMYVHMYINIYRGTSIYIYISYYYIESIHIVYNPLTQYIAGAYCNVSFMQL